MGPDSAMGPLRSPGTTSHKFPISPGRFPIVTLL